MNVLGVETSCDETAVAIVRDGRSILANMIASQIELHKRFGGVYPELASRQHVLAITPALDQALAAAQFGWDQIDAIAATQGPGLAGSLVVGLNFAKGLALARGLPFIGINHLEGHIYTAWLVRNPEEEAGVPHPEFPALILIVSGGHTELVLMHGHGEYELLGHTLDDAAGEAFDKVARLLGLPYPGGPHVQRVAAAGNPNAFDLPRAMLPGSYDFSFSGLKTAVLRIVEKYTPTASMGAAATRSPTVMRELPVADLAASFQQAVVDVLVAKTRQAAEEFKVRQVLIVGGVAANAPLRQQMAVAIGELGVTFHYPAPVLCTDNAAATAAAAYYHLQRGETSSLGIDVAPSLRLQGAGSR
ncbi:MAG: tRNA (adenosine(37)-N6)-threonylcarbamoyltransferase complex transferase subunit TsaD [Ardenticatenaceae bacterium]|nr:tRNA (adenosine(37)-N6)-threonylcarbamoyltransferase complex transferase subunit TsaD [Ardenticatenaceae bacterium]